MVLDIAFAPMELAPTNFNAGDAVRVTVSFKYVVGVNKTVKLLAGPYSTNLFGKHLVNACVGQAEITLPASSTKAEGTGVVDFLLVPKSSGGIEDGTYGLRVWIEDTDAVAEQDNVIIVTGNSSSGDMLSGMMPMLMMLLMMGMIMPMTQQMGEE
ncbi:hypothetical protein Dform_01735 [Dehalogenimonas formicexedens]|uniref:CARDB protein n=1 Tax=Dehalogenimonas formicexedens TaxID=1839801 RepID=A0A1P8F9B2_9CHLR|nr:hypothetical protein [Dehalogenimonas formicexedens]APV43652.1 hypothetical protein Dform_00292 [Dehalogenimonas formicexedens]APV45054.1 hypothetical protein Dform_01735 [Dehalogenimonas formicexedens]